MSANDPICAAIVGLGRWGQNLMAAATNAPDHPLRFVQGVTRTPSKAAEFTKHHGIPVSDDYDAMLEDPAIQAVVLATPHSQHCDQICKAANAGKHVFVEKPLALTFDEARRAIDTCNNQGVTLAVGFNRRFLPAFQELYDAQTAGTLGAPLHIDANFSGPFGYQYNGDMWRGSVSENPAGGMAAMGIHMLDAMIHLLGPVENVSTLSRQTGHRSATGRYDQRATFVPMRRNRKPDNSYGNPFNLAFTTFWLGRMGCHERPAQFGIGFDR
jgi:predicted dehydrogenase